MYTIISSFISLNLIWFSSFSLSHASLLREREYGSSCRCIPGDPCWPEKDEWDRLNKTVEGRLIATTPIASVCHDPHYDETQCAALKKGWNTPSVHFSSSSSIMAPLSLNQSCDPYTPQSSPCQIGNYVEYAIAVTGASDVAAGLKFVQEKNIRLVIKNTGHDYLGKSTGKGALSLWTHNLKSLDVLDYNSPGYTGKAVRMGAGVQAFEAFEFADSNQLRVLGGECATVGLAGGYTQGGGHGTLSSTYGLAADNTLEWEVVTADGEHLTATSTDNSDLYWALSGGGGGTYAVVLSLTAKAFPDGIVSGASLLFNTTTTPLETFWELIEIWHTLLPALVDSGAMPVYGVFNTTFIITSLTVPDKSKEDVDRLLKPFVSELDKRQVIYSYNVTSSPNFLSHFTSYFGPLPEGRFIVAQITGGRLVPRSVVQSKQSNAALTTALRNMVSDGEFYVGGLSLNVRHSVAGNKPDSNAVLPAWRDAIASFLIVSNWNFDVPFDDMLKVEDRLTNEIVPEITKVTPGSGTYLSEGDIRLSTWKEDFYGANYQRLREVKGKYDPKDTFYAGTAVGSDEWKVDEQGRLCRV